MAHKWTSFPKSKFKRGGLGKARNQQEWTDKIMGDYRRNRRVRG